MKNTRDISPPRWATMLLAWYCKPALLEDLEGDLNECFQRNVQAKGAMRARLIYILDVFKFFRPYTVRKPEFLNILIHWMMIRSYIRTSGRTIVRSKLFSAINIVGLAISMSVGLIVITLIFDLSSYDNFHVKKERIYRIFTTHKTMDLATTSVKAGKLIQENISGVEALTILRRGFGGDVKIEEKTLPIGGLWADESFFDVFTFPMLKGDPATALREPYSLVLTEQTARKLFGVIDVLGRSVKMDTLNYVVTGIMKDIPKLSHIKFEAVASFSTVELQKPDTDGGFMSWGSIFMNYVYVVLPDNNDPQLLQANLDKLCAAENAGSDHTKITLSLQPVTEIALGRHLVNQLGPVVNSSAIWILIGLAVVVILSACFNYTNLSIARSLRRSREVGIRKVMGAMKGHVLVQFVIESVIISIIALTFAILLFLLLRSSFLSIHPFLERVFSLELTAGIILRFIVLAVVVGIAAGFFPALFFSRINSISMLKGVSSLQLFRHVSMRKALIVVQYVFSLMFITTTIIGYKQYKSFLTYDLGFSTENILNINLQGNKANLLKKELEELPEVGGASQSLLVMSLGNIYGGHMKHMAIDDSSDVWLNLVDEHYLPLHKYTFLAGRNFTPTPTGESEAVINEQTLKILQPGRNDPNEALGQEIVIDGKSLSIVGVVKDFHYETLEDNIEPVVFRYVTDQSNGYINVKMSTDDWPAAMADVERAWKKIDKIHPLDAKFYDDQIEQAYSPFAMMLKVIGFLSFLAVCISSMGLFGMVVFTTETRLKEVSIRKVMGASELKLIYLLSKGLLLLLAIAAAIALPVTYLFFDNVVLSQFAFHQPVGLTEMLIGTVAVMLIALLMVGTQTLKVSRANPAEVLKNES